MFSSVRKFLSYHKRKFIIGGIIVGGVFVVSQYTKQKIHEWRQRETQEFLTGLKRTKHFEGTENSCNQTIISVVGCMRNRVSKILDSEKVVNDLKSGCSDKISAWNKLKIYSIARTAAVIYAETMIVATLRVQVTLVGAIMFKNSPKAQENEKLDETIQQKYLNLCSYFVNEGIENLCNFIEEKVEEIVKSVSLSDKLNIRDLEQIYWAIMSSVLADESRDPVKNLAKYMFKSNVDQEIDPPLKKIIDETLDLMESNEIQTLIQSSVRSGFFMLIDRISDYFVDAPTQKNGIAICASEDQNSIGKQNRTSYTDLLVDFNKLTIPMAKIIPIINSQVPDAPTQNDIPNDWLQHLIADEKFRTFGANVYEAFSF